VPHAVFALRPTLVPLRVRVHPLMCLSPLQSTSSAQTLLGAEAPRQPSPSLFPLRDTSKDSPLAGEFSTARLRSAHSVSHALDGLLLSSPCRLISSYSHVRDSPFRGFVRCLASPPRRRPLPSCRWCCSSTGRLPSRGQLLAPRLQGFYSRQRPVANNRGFSPILCPIPS
jgi:hypothetical protein